MLSDTSGEPTTDTAAAATSRKEDEGDNLRLRLNDAVMDTSKQKVLGLLEEYSMQEEVVSEEIRVNSCLEMVSPWAS